MAHTLKAFLQRYEKAILSLRNSRLFEHRPKTYQSEHTHVHTHTHNLLIYKRKLRLKS